VDSLWLIDFLRGQQVDCPTQPTGMGFDSKIFDDFVKSPPVPLEAGLRVLSRLWRESFIQSHPFADLLRVHHI
jgi:hypothetical protein